MTDRKRDEKRCEIKAKIWLEKDGIPAIGEGRAHLLRQIEEHGSLASAARDLGMSYRHAWGIIQKIADAVGTTVVQSERGGAGGGGTRLTEAGHALLKEYEDAIKRLSNERI